MFMNDRELILISAIILVVVGFGAFIVFGTDVFAQDAISEDTAKNIVNATATASINVSAGDQVTVGKPKKYKQNGKSIWKVPVTYRGNNPTLAGKFNGDVTVPAKTTNGQFDITLGDGTHITGSLGPGGSINIQPAPTPAPTTAPTPTQQPSQPTKQSTPTPTVASQKETCPTCGGMGMINPSTTEMDPETCPTCGGTGYIYN